MYPFLFLMLPLILSFGAQSLLCRRGKSRLIRGGLAILLLVPMAVGAVKLAVGRGEFFGGLDAVGALLWMAASVSALCGYGLAWLLFFVIHKNKSNRSEGASLQP